LKAILSHKSIKLILILLGAVLLIKGGSSAYFYLTDGFHSSHIETAFPYRESWSIDSEQLSEDEVKTRLNQNFFWLDKGAQFYTFIGEDEETVLKIVKQKHLRLPYWEKKLLSLLNLKGYRQKREEKKKSKYLELLRSVKIAFEELKEETALLYHHFQQTDSLKTTARIHDKLGLAYELDMDSREFLLQRKVLPLIPALDQAIEARNLADAKQKIDQMVILLVSRSEKGIYDSDKRLIENVGYLNNRAVFIDIGSFTKIFNYPIDEELIVRTRILKHRLKGRSPELAIYLDEAVHWGKPQNAYLSLLFSQYQSISDKEPTSH